MPNIVRRPTGTEAGDLYNELLKNRHLNPEYAPELKAITCDTVATLRNTKGDLSGNAGPRCVVLNATATPGDGGAGIFYWHNTIAGQGGASIDDNGTTYVQVMGPDGKFVTPGAWVRVPQPSTLLRRSWLTSGTSLPVMSGCKRIVFRMKAGGGGSGGANGSVAVGGGGAEGGYAEGQTTTIPAAITYSIGAGGTAGSSTGGNGGTGGNTTFSDGTNLATAFGGPGGSGSTAGVGPVVVAGGQAPAASSGAIVTLPGSGAPGSPGMTLNNVSTTSVSGAGGGQGGGQPKLGVSGAAAGAAGIGLGSGASGAVSAGTAQAGAAGAGGWLYTEEWSG